MCSSSDSGIGAGQSRYLSRGKCLFPHRHIFFHTCLRVTCITLHMSMYYVRAFTDVLEPSITCPVDANSYLDYRLGDCTQYPTSLNAIAPVPLCATDCVDFRHLIITKEQNTIPNGYAISILFCPFCIFVFFFSFLERTCMYTYPGLPLKEEDRQLTTTPTTSPQPSLYLQALPPSLPTTTKLSPSRPPACAATASAQKLLERKRSEYGSLPGFTETSRDAARARKTNK